MSYVRCTQQGHQEVNRELNFLRLLEVWEQKSCLELSTCTLKYKLNQERVKKEVKAPG